MIRVFVAICLAAVAFRADAGAWPQPKGEAFLSFSAEFPTTQGNSADRSLWLEYGLTPRVTVGFDGFFSGSGGDSTALAFVRLPIGQPAGATRLAVSFALGQESGSLESGRAQGRIGWHWGRGLDKGWLALDASATLTAGGTAPGLKADFTWGMRSRDRLMLIWQLQTGGGMGGAEFVKFAPTAAWAMGEKKRVQINLGLIVGLSGDSSRKVSLGLWQRF